MKRGGGLRGGVGCCTGLGKTRESREQTGKRCLSHDMHGNDKNDEEGVD